MKMAASMVSRWMNICLISGTVRSTVGSLHRVGPSLMVKRRCYCTDQPKSGLKFNDAEVQTILKKITGLNMEKVFRPKKKRLDPPKYTLLSEQKLKEMEEKARAEAEELLQMPPVLDEREEINEVLSDDRTLAGLETAKIVFTDISYGVSERLTAGVTGTLCNKKVEGKLYGTVVRPTMPHGMEALAMTRKHKSQFNIAEMRMLGFYMGERLVVVRDPDGVLRKASWEERDRMMQIYFPRPHRQMEPPPLFQDEQIRHVLDQERYEQLLDAACVQFEPDNADFIRVHRRVYDHIDKSHHYDSLRSTRHFGGMAYYFVRNKHIEGLLADMMERNLFSDAADLAVAITCQTLTVPSTSEIYFYIVQLIQIIRLSDAADLVRLYHMMHPDCASAKEGIEGLDELDIIKAFVALDARDKGKLELLIQQQEAGTHTSEVQQ